MAKTITIPTDLGYENQMVLTINGKTYSYTPGDTVSVPDEAAALIADMERQQPGGIRTPAVQTDWNEKDSSSSAYIQNRPFYTDGETVVPLPDQYIPAAAAKAADLEALEARVAALEAP